jgi:hypothetical protein
MAYPANLPAPTQTQTLAAEIKAAKDREQPEDPHLRSAKLVTGYYIGASDGEIEHVEDFIIDDESWTIHYMVVDTRNWWPGKKVVISPEWIENVSWTDSTVYVEPTRGAIKKRQNTIHRGPSIVITKGGFISTTGGKATG